MVKDNEVDDINVDMSTFRMNIDEYVECLGFGLHDEFGEDKDDKREDV